MPDASRLVMKSGLAGQDGSWFMVNCFDRIAVQMTEIALEPVKMLEQRAMLHAVSLRTVSSGRRFAVTIEKRLDEDGKTARFVWKLDELTPSGESLPDGANAALPLEQAFADPEDAYWSAIDRMCEITRG